MNEIRKEETLSNPPHPNPLPWWERVRVRGK